MPAAPDPLAGLARNPPPDPDRLAEFLRVVALDLPPDYLDFLRASDGAAGDVGGRFVRLDGLTDILANTRAHGLYSKKLLHVGSDGGEVAYCLSFKQKPFRFVSLGYHETRSKPLGDTLANALATVAAANAAGGTPKPRARPKPAGPAALPADAPDGLLFELKHRDAVIALAVSPDGTRLLTADADRQSYLWDLATGARLAVVNHARLCRPGAAVTADGRALVLTDRDPGHVNRVLIVWDVAAGRALSEVEVGPAGGGGTGAVAPDGSFALFFKPHDLQAFWDVTTGQRIAELPRPVNAAFAVAVAPDAGSFALGCRDAVLEPGRTWADGPPPNRAGWVLGYSRTGSPLGRFQAHSAPVTALAFAADGRLATASAAEVRVWPAGPWAGADPVLNLPVPLTMVTALAFLGRDKFAVATYSGGVAIHDARTGDLRYTLPTARGAAGLLAATPDGSRLVTAQGDDPEAKAIKSARVWRVPPAGGAG